MIPVHGIFVDQITDTNPDMRTSNYFTLKFHVVEVTLRVIFHTHTQTNEQ